MTAPKMQPIRNARIMHFHPKNNPANAISLMSPPPNASIPLIARPINKQTSINPLITQNPIGNLIGSCDLILFL